MNSSSSNSCMNKFGKKKLKGDENRFLNQKALNREKIHALRQDVEKLKNKLRLEENMQRAMKRAFNRPLGTLPRLPPFLPPKILELLAEVAVLEEEMVRFEEHIVHCRQELYQEAAFSSSLSNAKGSDTLLSRKPMSVSESLRGKENKLNVNSPIKKMPIQLNKNLEAEKLEESLRLRKTNAELRSYGYDPNKVSEDLVKCLSNIFMNMSSVKRLPIKDPYGICSRNKRRDIGPYKNCVDVKAASINSNRTLSPSLYLIRQLKLLLGRVSSVNLQKLNQQEKLAFWINIYNSCMMNSFLEHGVPESSEMVVTQMQKATINVAGHVLNAITIEHFILRLPYHSKYISQKGSNELAVRSKFGLELSEPLVTFALSCGSWSSPAVRVYTANNVEEELEIAKREFLEASVAISMAKIRIPKLMDWYSHDFAKDNSSLLDWICLQLPPELRIDALNCLQQEMSQSTSTHLQMIPYNFSFRYLFSI